MLSWDYLCSHSMRNHYWNSTSKEFVKLENFNQHLLFYPNYCFHIVKSYFIFSLARKKHFIIHSIDFKVLRPNYLMSENFVRFSLKNLSADFDVKPCFDYDLEHYFRINFMQNYWNYLELVRKFLDSLNQSNFKCFSLDRDYYLKIQNCYINYLLP